MRLTLYEGSKPFVLELSIIKQKNLSDPDLILVYSVCKEIEK